MYFIVFCRNEKISWGKKRLPFSKLIIGKTQVFFQHTHTCIFTVIRKYVTGGAQGRTGLKKGVLATPETRYICIFRNGVLSKIPMLLISEELDIKGVCYMGIWHFLNCMTF